MNTCLKSNRSRLLSTVTLFMLCALVMIVSAQSGLAQGENPPPPMQLESPVWEEDGISLFHVNIGNVGIGTNQPVYLFDVLSPTPQVARFGHTSGNSHVLITAPTGFSANLNLLQGDEVKWYLGNRPSNDRFSIMSANGVTELFTMLQNGRVGINTTTPGFLFDLQGGQINSSGGFCIAGDCKTAWSQTSQWTTATGSNIYFASGNVGIGTSAPNSLLDINSNQNAVARLIALNNPSAGAGAQSAISFFEGGTEKAKFGVNSSGAAGYVGGQNAFQVWNFSNAPIVFGTNGAERLRVNASGSVGIGTTSPGFRLDVQGGQINSSDGLCIAGDCKSAWSQLAQWSTSGANLSYSTGNIGIGTGSPGEKLVTIGNFLAGNITTQTQLYGSYSSQANVIMELGYGTATAADAPLASLVISKNLTGANNVVGAIQFANRSIADGSEKRLAQIANYTDGATNSGLLLFGTASAGTLGERMRITSAGRVGIGTTAPTANLEVSSGTAQFAPAVNIMASAHATSERAAISFGINPAGNVGWSFGQDRNGNGTRDMYLFDVANSRDAMYWSSNGSVGIGTTTPSASYKLDANGSINAGGLCIAGDCKTAWSQVASTTGAANVSAGQFGANVGGGNYSFPGSVDIAGTISWGSTNSRTEFKHDAGALASKSGFFETVTPVNYPAGASSWWHLIEARHSNNANNYALQIAGSFFDQNVYARKTNNNGATAWSKFVLQDSSNNVSLPGSGVWSASGNVGIGTTGPTAKLDVVGNVNVSGAGSGNITASGAITGGTINAKYQDVAEWVASSQALPVGTVVVLDQTRSNQVVASSHSYDTTVAGVISAQPGITLGERGESKVLVATTGRVKVRVDAGAGPIRIGDLLVTSDIAGVAKKSEPLDLGGVRIHRPGTLIGKALEPLASGAGEILILLSLQ